MPRAKKVFDPDDRQVPAQRARASAGSTSRRSRSGKKYETGTQDNYRVQGLTGADARNTYGIAAEARPRQEGLPGHQGRLRVRPGRREVHQGRPDERGPLVPDADHPAATARSSAVSGLDEIGQLVPGKNEIYDPKTKKWTYTEGRPAVPDLPGDLPDAERQALLLAASNAGYGPDDVGRDPGIWDLKTNKFTKLPGLSDPKLLETAGDGAAAARAGREVHGDRRRRGRRVRAVQQRRPGSSTCKADDPKFVDGPTLEKGTRYPQRSILPDDTVLISGGSRGLPRARRLQHPPGADLRREDERLQAGRRPAGGPQLPLGLDPAARRPGDVLRLRLALRRQGQHQAGHRSSSASRSTRRRTCTGTRGPTLSGRAEDASRAAASATFTTRSTPSSIKTARLIRPSASTHVTDVDQRSIALDFKKTKDGITVTVPEEPQPGRSPAGTCCS